MATEAFKRQVVSNLHVSDEEAAQFLATNEWRYFERYWRPILPARVWTVLSVLHDHIRFDKATWQKKETCWPSQPEIAARAHMCERTVNRILHRDAAGRFDYTYREQVYWIAGERDVARYSARATLARQHAQARREQQRQATQADLQGDTPTPPEATATTPPKPITCPYQPGQLIAGKVEEIPDGYDGPVYALGDLIALFIKKVDPRFHFNAGIGRWERTSNVYHVAAILPPVPDITAKNTLMINLADVRAARAKMQEEAAEQSPPLVTEAPTNWQLLRTDKLAGEATPPKPCITEDGVSILPKVVEPVTIGKSSGQQPGRAASTTSPSQNKDDEAMTLTTSHHIEQATTAAARRSLGQTSEHAAAPGLESDTPADLLTPIGDAGGGVHTVSTAVMVEEVPPSLPASAFLSEGEILRIQTDAVIGKVIEDVARQVMLDKNTRSTRAQVVLALSTARTPLDQLLPALYLGRNRVARFLCAGGTINKTLPGFFISTMRNLAKDGRSLAYEFAKQDTAEHVAHVAEGAGDYSYIQTPDFRNSPQRSINPRGAPAARQGMDEFRATLERNAEQQRAWR